MPKPNYCGRCKHWNKRPESEQTYSIDIGDCDKIKQGTKFVDDGKEYEYDGYSFEDEIYDNCMHCFEPVYATNGDRIRNMTDEEFAAFIEKVIDCCSDGWMCNECPLNNVGDKCSREQLVTWLKSEVNDAEEP